MLDYIKKLSNPRNAKNFLKFLILIRNPFILPVVYLFPKTRKIKFDYNKKQIVLFYRNIYDLAIIFEMFVTWVYKKEFVSWSLSIADVGWHCDYFAVWAVYTNPVTTVYSFEPEEENQDIFQKNIKANDLENHITLNKYGLSDKDEEIKFYTYPNSADNSAILYKHIAPIATSTILVKNTFTELSKIKPDFLKIDIEWSEDLVLYSYLDWGGIPKYISVEFSNNPKRSDMDAIKKYLCFPCYNHEHEGIIVNSTRYNS